MSSKVRQAHRMMCDAIIARTERNLGRKLSAAEQSAIEAIPSLMMLEAVARGFDAPETSAEQIEHDLSEMMRR